MRPFFVMFILTACSTPHEGEFIGSFEGMAWVVECGPNGLHEIHERWEYENPNACDSENLNAGEINGYGMCAEWMRVRYRYEWAKAEFRRKCERDA